MKNKKPKFVQIVMGVGKGCAPQISRKQSYMLNPIRVMEKKGFICEFWILGKNKKKQPEYYGGVLVRRFSNTFSLLLNLFLDKSIKLVYAQLRPYPPSLFSPLSLKKCILMTQTYELGSNWLVEKLSLFFMKRFTRVFALTPYEKELYIKKGLRKEKVICFPHAIDYSFFSRKPKKDLSAVRKKYGIKNGDFVITSVANFRRFKNLDVMVGAFALFRKTVKKAKMVLAGIDQTKNPVYKEQDTARYKNVEDADAVIKREKISKDVIFTGSLNYKKVREILYISDVFVNTSDPEGMGMAVYEAASAGVPLCLSNIGSFTSVFKGMALYSRPRDSKQLADNYLKYYTHPTLRQKAGSRLRQYLKKWDYSIAMERFDKIFSEILSNYTVDDHIFL